ncbi:MAG: hypothetical protein IPK82_39285 [Polyangiaceae bacterium]|nr:hypothetical protein [Polyangiaceae bacterium]
MASLLPLLLLASSLDRPVLRAERTDRPPVIDGKVDDEVWKKAPGSSKFTQKFPVDGVAPAEPTTVKILYDDTTIYVAVECTQKTVPIVNPLTRRDRDVESERCHQLCNA